MNRAKMYKRYRFPPEIIHYAVWTYFRFELGHRDIEELLGQRDIMLPENQFDCGAIGSNRNMPPDCVNNIKDMVTRSSSMRFLPK